MGGRPDEVGTSPETLPSILDESGRIIESGGT
jgi:hypothetical protein